jgi:very-short-patch-repair endonuclease
VVHPEAPARRPTEPTDDERERWRALGKDKFRDADYQRYAQGWRSEESLRESGRAGFAETARRHGRDFAADVLARSRLAHPTAPERETIALLGELGQREGTDYYREYRVAPGVYADFAWPERKLAVEVHGSAHDAEFFLARGMAEREARRTVVYDEAGWTVRVVTDRDLAGDRERTRERLREAIIRPAQGTLC